jgi:hypothetical protein
VRNAGSVPVPRPGSPAAWRSAPDGPLRVPSRRGGHRDGEGSAPRRAAGRRTGIAAREGGAGAWETHGIVLSRCCGSAEKPRRRAPLSEAGAVPRTASPPVPRAPAGHRSCTGACPPAEDPHPA